MDGDETVVTPQAARPVWAALEAGVAVEPQDIVVVILPAEAPADLDDPAPSPPLHRRRARAAFRGAVGAVLSAAVLLLGVLTAVAVTPSFLGDSNRPAPSGAGRVAGARPATFDAYAALARSADVTVYERPDSGSSPVRSFPAVGDYGARQTFLIEREQPLPDGVWYEVLLPVRPNGTKGWVRGSDVEVAGLPYRIKVHLGSLRLELYRDGRLERTFPIGIGTGDTPTPPGRYSIRYLMRPDDQNTLYGHYVYGLSGFSDVVRDVPGGGELGIHGTNDPNGSIGNRVSQGCIRLRNEDIASLVPLLPLGTPVDVVDDRPPPKNQ
jgi:lipoprotein-anchoring transpeptidase ErfK/SrfK